MRYLIFLLIMTSILFAEDKSKLAVMDIEDKTGTLEKSLLENGRDHLRSLFVSSNRYIVISKERQRVVQIRESQKESYKGCYDKNCQIPLGQALSADSIVRSTITKFGKNYTITAELISLAKEATIRGGRADFDGSIDDFKKAINAIAASITEEQIATKGQKSPPQPEVVRPYRWHALSAFIVGAATLGSGIYFSLESTNAKDEMNYYNSEEGGFDHDKAIEYRDDSDLYGNSATALYITSAVFIAAGTALFLITEEKKDESAHSFDFNLEQNRFTLTYKFSF